MATSHRDSHEPTVVIVEPHHDVAVALEDVVKLAHCSPLIVSGVESLQRLHLAPAAIVVRVSADLPLRSPHAGLDDLPRANRPMIVALVATQGDIAEAERLDCEVVVRAPGQIQGLYDVLTGLTSR